LNDCAPAHFASAGNYNIARRKSEVSKFASLALGDRHLGRRGHLSAVYVHRVDEWHPATDVLVLVKDAAEWAGANLSKHIG